jgi:hypothetical protein
MKKLFFTLALVLAVFALSAQSFRVVTENGDVVESGSSFYVYGQGNEWGELALELEVEALEDVTLVAQKVEINVIEGTYNMLCLDQCYAPSVYVTPEVAFANGDSKDFSMHYQYEESLEAVAGMEQLMQYIIYPADDTHNQFVINVTFKYSLDGIEENSLVNEFSNAYPSPARDMVNFDYSFNAGVNNAAVAIYNMMGQEVLRSDISGMSGKASLNVSDLAEGVYFYSLIVNGANAKSGKLVVSR